MSSARDQTEVLVVLSRLTAQSRWREFDAIISIESLANPESLEVTDVHPRDRLVLRFEDVDFDLADQNKPKILDVQTALEFARNVTGSLLVHCEAGISRSTAVAIAIAADRLGPGEEGAAVGAIVDQVKGAMPNLLVLQYADMLLGRDGKLVDAWRTVEQRQPDVAHARRRKHLRRLMGRGST
ncbi:dual specificity protein phosphatase family protein [Ensifer sp. IC4062]|nr:hypothetical protein [Ensifer sp. IC4062]MCA1441951.1 dual specificity protein phosphatase family protein [Ensifer sp. IC4062]